ncbi:MAG TPA: Flp family type IVb pilin [Candidatus Baltobacteraceae bacterium]|nr:Flp family type IVb pilin [Candidatus Baltobacteraceae bacterium]
MIQTLKAMLANEDGATLVEYALIVALIAVVALLAISALGKNASTTLSTAANSI